MRWRNKSMDVFQWHRWFAWHPVSTGLTVVWCETIERRLWSSSPMPWWEYRECEGKSLEKS